MEKIGFFGGCFNPPNILHVEIAENLIKNKQVDKVIFIPVNDYYKKDGLIEAKHRYNMLNLATEKYNNLYVDDIEIKENRKLYAIDAFELMQKSNFITEDNKDNIYFIMGSDNYEKMPKWKDYDRIKDKYKYIIVERNKISIPSTKIREMIFNNSEEVKKYLSEEVYQYIVKNNLYK